MPCGQIENHPFNLSFQVPHMVFREANASFCSAMSAEQNVRACLRAACLGEAYREDGSAANNQDFGFA